jgi:hypothetical protein
MENERKSKKFSMMEENKENDIDNIISIFFKDNLEKENLVFNYHTLYNLDIHHFFAILDDYKHLLNNKIVYYSILLFFCSKYLTQNIPNIPQMKIESIFVKLNEISYHNEILDCYYNRLSGIEISDIFFHLKQRVTNSGTVSKLTIIENNSEYFINQITFINYLEYLININIGNSNKNKLQYSSYSLDLLMNYFKLRVIEY